MNQFTYSQIIAPDIDEARIDQIGLAILRDEARKQSLQVVGEEVTRVEDHLVYEVPIIGADNQPTTHFVPADMAGDMADEPAGRAITWEAPVRPADTGPVPAFTADQLSVTVAKLVLPDEVAVQGGLIEITHGLGGAVTARPLAADGTPLNPRFTSEIDDNTIEMDIVPGTATSVEIVLDDVTDAEEGQ